VAVAAVVAVVVITQDLVQALTKTAETEHVAAAERHGGEMALLGREVLDSTAVQEMILAVAPTLVLEVAVWAVPVKHHQTVQAEALAAPQ
jgi:hypothetical protein